MKVITFQHKSVVEEINEKGVYLCTHLGGYHKATPKSYEFLKKAFKEKYPNEAIIYPIFGWSQTLKVGVPVDENNEKCIERMLEMTGFSDDNYKMLVLEVPDDKVLETDFYGFVDLRCEEEFGDVIFNDTYTPSVILTPREDNVTEIQAILGSIEKEWIVEIRELPHPDFKWSDEYKEEVKAKIIENGW